MSCNPNCTVQRFIHPCNNSARMVILMAFILWSCLPMVSFANTTNVGKVAYDIDMAKEICDELPLESIEGIWLYPDDNVTVLILADESGVNPAMQDYTISVVETSDARLHPGDILGTLTATPEEKTYKINLATERNNDLLLKQKSCLAKLNSDGDAFTIKKQKSPFKARLNLNFNRLLPGFWKIVSTGISQSGSSSEVKPAVGMIKIYPSYDGNGSSRRKVRYL